MIDKGRKRGHSGMTDIFHANSIREYTKVGYKAN